MARILAASSGGGHWDELLALRDAFAGHDVTYLTTSADLLMLAGVSGTVVADCNRDTPLATLRTIVAIARLVWRLRPDRVVSTGAAPGLICILLGRMLGARTLWIESIANAERLSMSGRIASKAANRCVVQWEHMARPTGPDFAGAIF